jgi:hypothetical protein
MYNDFKNLMSINKHGLMKNRSTITNLFEYESFVLNSIEDGNQVDPIYTDFSKAFDRVLHQLLLNEMSAYRARKMHVAGILSVGENQSRKKESVTQYLRISR